MLKILKYLLPVVFAVAFWSGTDGSVADIEDGFMNETTFDVLCCQDSITETESHLCLPRQISSGNASRLQTSARRTTCIQRSNLEFAKSGKIINAGITYLVQTNFIFSRSTLYEPSSRLVTLGRLII